MTTPRTFPRRGTALLAAAGLLAGAAGATWWATLTPTAAQAEVGAISVPAAVTESVYACPASPGNSVGAVDLGQTSSATSITVLGAGTRAAYGGQRLEDSTLSTDDAVGGVLTLAPGQDSEASATGLVTTSTASGDLRGLTASACAPASAVSWIVGGSAALGSSSELRLVNPGRTTVTATVTLYGSTGPLTLPSGGQVAVPAGGSASVLLESASAADARVAVSVGADGGMLIPSLATESLDGETPAGTDVLTAGAAPSTDLLVPGVVLADPEKDAGSSDAGSSGGEAHSGAQDGGGVQAAAGPALRIVNPSEAEATVSVTLVGADGEKELPGAQSLVIDPGAVFDVSLEGVAAGTYGIRVTSDQPVAGAARLVRTAGEYPAGSGTLMRDVAWVQAQDAAVVADAALTVPAPGRGQTITSTLVLTNPARQSATVTLAAATGSWSQEVTVPGGKTVSVDLDADTLPQGTGALTLSAPQGSQVRAAAVLTQSVEGDAAGTLIAVVPPVADAAAASARSLQLR